MNVRLVPLVAGFLAFAGAIAQLGGVVSVNATQGTIILVGVVTALVATNSLFKRRGVREHAETPDPEHRSLTPVPGADLASAVDQFR